MSKQLVLMRHAKSDWSGMAGNDFDRPLNNRGYRDAPLMGLRLANVQHFKPDFVISSPAERAKLTAQYVCEQLPYEEEKLVFEQDIYEASPRTLLRITNELDDKYEKVLLVGHNLGLTHYAEFLTKTVIGNIPTAGIVSISFEIDSWKMVSEGLGRLDWFIYPKDGYES
jgi:phosphohistidine phosphatase